MTISSSPALSRRGFLAVAVGAASMTAAIPGFAAAAKNRPSLTGALALAFDGPSLVLAANGLWLSADGGENWTATGDPGPLANLYAHPDRPGTVFGVLAAGGVIRSRDGGRSWQPAARGLPGAPVDALTIAAHEPDMLYAALRGDGLWRSQDAGESWEFVMDRPYLGGNEHDVLSLASVNNASGMGGIWVYAGTDVGLTRVPDCFCRWQDVTPGDAMDALVAGTAPAAPKSLPAGEPVQSLGLAPGSPDTIYAGMPSGIWKSTDAGVNWLRMAEGAARQIAVDPAESRHVVALGDGTIRSSRDGGDTWKFLNTHEGE